MIGRGIVPVVVVVHCVAVPAAIMRLERRVVPLHTGIGSGDYSAFAVIAQSPDVGGLYPLNVPLHTKGLKG